MDAIYLLIPITVIFLIAAVAIFFWAVNSDQYSDLDKEAHRILFDQESSQEKKSGDKEELETGERQIKDQDSNSD